MEIIELRNITCKIKKDLDTINNRIEMTQKRFHESEDNSRAIKSMKKDQK